LLRPPAQGPLPGEQWERQWPERGTGGTPEPDRRSDEPELVDPVSGEGFEVKAFHLGNAVVD
jgi:hypothetical protein